MKEEVKDNDVDTGEEQVEFKNNEKPNEEDRLKKEKADNVKREEEEKEEETEEEEAKEEAKEEVKERKQEKQQSANAGIIGSSISLAWNTLAVDKGYEEINEKEQDILKEVWQPIEDKYIGNKATPEGQAVIVSGFILLPKFIAKRQRDKQNGTKVSDIK